MLHLETPHLVLEPVDPHSPPYDLLTVFNSNPDFLEATRGEAMSAFDLPDVKTFIQSATSRAHDRCLAIRLRETGRLIGAAVIVATHTGQPYPWLGLLILDSAWQGRGLGAEAVQAIESYLVHEGWPEVHLCVLEASPRARQFWERQGYAVYGERRDREGRACWLLCKALVVGEPQHA